MKRETAGEIADYLLSADQTAYNFSQHWAHGRRRQTLVRALVMLTEPTAWLAPVDSTDSGAAAYVVCPGRFAVAEARFAFSEEEANWSAPSMRLRAVTLRPEHAVTLEEVRLRSEIERRWTFDLGDEKVAILATTKGDDFAHSRENAVAEALAGEIGWNGASDDPPHVLAG